MSSSNEKPSDECPGEALPSFEEALLQLETAVRKLETGELDLADALDCYEQGIRQLKHCYRLLDGAERRVEMLTGVDDAGRPVTEEFADDELSLEEKRGHRAARRTHNTRGGQTARPERRSASTTREDTARRATESDGQADMDDSEGLF